ncbi:hypothetical protein MAH1_19670 [Sessilibacter sp. MAH1]
MNLQATRTGNNKTSAILAKFLVVAFTSFVLVACGGGSGGSSDNAIGEAPSSGGGGSATGEDDSGTVTVDPVVRIGNGTGANFQLGVIGADDTSLQAGGSTTLRINFVDSDADPVTAVQTVSFSSQCFAMNLSTFSLPTLETNSSGFGTTNYTANGCSGEDVVTATAVLASGDVVVAQVTLTIETDQVLSISFESATNEFLSLAGIGGTQTSLLTFRLVGAQGASIVGESVTFTTDAQNRSGGARIASGTETDISNAEGIVSTVLQSGTAAGNVRVIVTHNATQISAQSDSIVVSSGLPVQRSFSLSQTSVNPSRAGSADGIEIDVSIRATDQFGNDIATGTQVNFFAECGRIEPSCEIGDDSSCTVTWESNNASQDDAGQRCSILAFTEGTETFADVNANFVYEDVDVFDLDEDDLPEPFLDANESGSWEFGEIFVDRVSGQANVYDQPNGFWDGVCLIDIIPSANCDGDDTATIFAHGLVVGSGDGVGLTVEVYSDAGLTNLVASSNHNGILELGGVTSGFLRILLEDFDIEGNPPGIGTDVDIMSSGGLSFVAASVTIDNRSTPFPVTVPFTASGVDGAINLVADNPDLDGDFRFGIAVSP